MNNSRKRKPAQAAGAKQIAAELFDLQNAKQYRGEIWDMFRFALLGKMHRKAVADLSYTCEKLAEAVTDLEQLQ